MSPESGSREPVTEAGRTFLTAMVRPFLTTNAVETRNRLDAATAGIAAIEAEAVSRFAEALRMAVEAMAPPPSADEDYPYPYFDYMISRRAVLAEIERLSQAPAEGET